MDQQAYIESRVDDQIGWYDRKSQRAQSWFKRIRLAEVVLAAAIPFLAGFATDSVVVQILIGLFGVIIVILAALLTLNQYQENWIEYRTTCESLKHEKFMFLAGAEPYDVEAPFPLFVKRVESLISRQNSEWSQSIRAGAEASKTQSQPGGA